MALPSLSQIRNWDTAHLQTAARHWTTTAAGWEGAFSTAHRGALSPGGADWDGRAAEATQARTLADLYRVRGLADVLDGAARAARAGAADLETAKQQVLDSVRRAEAAGFDVHDDLSLSTRHGVTAAEYPAKLAEGQELSAEINARALRLAELDAEVAAKITAAVAPLGEVSFAEGTVQSMDAPLSPHLSPAPEPDGGGGGGDAEQGSEPPKTWQDMLLPDGPAAAENPAQGEERPPTLQDQLFPPGTTADPKEVPKNLDQALEATAPGLGAAMEQQRQAALSRVPSVQDLKSDPAVVAAARDLLAMQGVPPESMDAALDRFLQDTHRLGEYLALNPTMPQPDPVPQPAPGFVDGFRDRWFANEAFAKSLFGTGDSKSPGVLESWQALLGGLQETISDPVGAVKDEIDRALNSPSAAYYLGEWAADGTQSAGSAVVFGPETLAARAALGGLTHETLDSTTSVAKPATGLDDITGAGPAPSPHVPSPSTVHAPPALPADSPLFDSYQPTPPGPDFTNADGSLVYPDDSLPGKPYAVPGTVAPDVQLPKGTVVDRFGHPGGSWMSPEGVPFAERALPPVSVDKPYYQYVVADPANLPPGYTIERSQAAPWFNQPGGGVQYRILDADGNNASVQDLIDAQYLRKVNR
ncbi:TNT domain-containing protein [Mycobacterium sp. ACS4331]|uniref:TNT domain-containing protein n=1 Tax=Mycobacterium sp. ACS4331 TaxID=1834121 RepID=UPI0007FEE35F|nr:TNT domain-containing protein [Mycobacterium sp. ACS4331]OBF18918.1 hypothetical protein A5727_10880 [Mycobacterium sp. ACS4331]